VGARRPQREVQRVSLQDLIRVSLRGGVWYAQFIGPHAEIIRGLFGTDLIPTPWTGDSDPDEVLADLMARNPGFEVSIDC
jgi:hypothetical protein